jgi:hypothetical protein
MATTVLPATQKQQKQCKASKCLVLLTSDFNIITDWAFYFHCCNGNREYQAKYLEDPDANSLPYLTPPVLVLAILVVCGHCG